MLRNFQPFAAESSSSPRNVFAADLVVGPFADEDLPSVCSSSVQYACDRVRGCACARIHGPCASHTGRTSAVQVRSRPYLLSASARRIIDLAVDLNCSRPVDVYWFTVTPIDAPIEGFPVSLTDVVRDSLHLTDRLCSLDADQLAESTVFTWRVRIIVQGVSLVLIIADASRSFRNGVGRCGRHDV